MVLKWRILMEIYYEAEQRLYSALKIQCQVRIYHAKLRMYNIRFAIKLREWAALTIQKTWYLAKNAFHTFLLMCCCRVADVEENSFVLRMIARGKIIAAKQIQRLYKIWYFHRCQKYALMIQCWYRGVQGYRYTHKLRRQLWASRKLHHWARSMMKIKHSLVRRLQKWYNLLYNLLYNP